MGLKLHGLALSTCTAHVATAIYEKGQEFELIPVNLTTGEHKQPGFLAKNPFGQIPALEDGGLTLFESRAIALYVAEKYKDSGYDLIKHNDLKEAALVKVWSEVESQTFHPVISTIVHQHLILPLFGQQSDQAVIDANLDKLKNILDVYESRLKNSKYLAGDFFSMADLNHLPYLFYFMRSPWTSLVNDRALSCQSLVGGHFFKAKLQESGRWNGLRSEVESSDGFLLFPLGILQFDMAGFHGMF